MFERFRSHAAPAPRTGLTDGIEGKIAAFVKDWGALQRGEREAITDRQEEPLKLQTDADVALFTKSMEDELAKVEAFVTAEMNRAHNARVAQLDAEIAAKHREIESAKARIAAQDAEVDRRASSLAALIQTAEKIDPAFKIGTLDTARAVNEDEIRKEIVRRKFGDVAVDGKSQAYIDERFESLVARVNVDPFARVVADGLVSTGPDNGRAAADKAYSDMVDSLTSAHRRTTH